MAISVSIFSNANATTKTVTLDFLSEIAVLKKGPSPTTTRKTHYIRTVTNGNDTSGTRLPHKVIAGLDDLVLNGNSQAQANTTVAYNTITELIEDNIYDYLYGHTDNQFSTGVTAQLPMDFS